jgi:hypothetical protein
MRNKKYMRQINQEDARYNVLRTIPTKKGGHYMVYSQMGYKVDVIKDGKIILSYIENNHYPPNGEISLIHYHSDRVYKHIIGKKFPPCFMWVSTPRFMWASNSKTTKKWIEYTSIEDSDPIEDYDP